MLKAVLFDMDETLLDINLGAFCALWAKDVSEILADIGRKNQLAALVHLGAAFYALNRNDRAGTDNRTNRAFFYDEINRSCHVDLSDPVVFDALAYYERDMLPRKGRKVSGACPRAGAHEALEACMDRGLKVALLTNPSFTEAGIRCRMGWAKIDDVPFELVTTMDNCTRVKPSPVYYLESLEKLGLEPHEALMVGNDPRRDFPTPDCGLRTAYVGEGADKRAIWSGDMADLAGALDEIIDTFEDTTLQDAVE